MANYGFKIYTNIFLPYYIISPYNSNNLSAGSISYSTPHRLSNASGYANLPYNYGAYYTSYGSGSGTGVNNPRGQTLRISYKYDNRKLKFWSSTTTTPASGSSGPVCTEISPTSETWDDNLGWIYEVTWPSDANSFIITEDNKYENAYSYHNIDRTKITSEVFFSRWDIIASRPTTSSYIVSKGSSNWVGSLLQARRWNGTTWKTS